MPVAAAAASRLLKANMWLSLAVPLLCYGRSSSWHLLPVLGRPSQIRKDSHHRATECLQSRDGRHCAVSRVTQPDRTAVGCWKDHFGRSDPWRVAMGSWQADVTSGNLEVATYREKVRRFALSVSKQSCCSEREDEGNSDWHSRSTLLRECPRIVHITPFVPSRTRKAAPVRHGRVCCFARG